MNFFIDIGNSVIKSASDKEIHSQTKAVSHWYHDNLQDCFAAWKAHAKPARVFAACVAKPAIKNRINAWVTENWGMDITYAITQKNAYGLHINHQDPQQLGVDRWLAILAAWQTFHSSVLIIDCGTANTIDVVNSDGEHLGGFILPGFKLMQQALCDKAAAINIDLYDSHALAPDIMLTISQRTQTQIIHGSLLAIAAFIDRAIEQICDTHNIKPHCIITGGDAGGIKAHVKHALIYMPNLVLHGLQISAETS